MSGDIEQGICEVCNELKPLQRTYYGKINRRTN